MILDLIAISSDSFDDAILSIHRTKRMICDVPGCVARASNSEILLTQVSNDFVALLLEINVSLYMSFLKTTFTTIKSYV